MAKERRCRKCNLTYKGLKTTCPFCHKSTNLGIFNKIMCVFGYISFLLTLIIFVYYVLIQGIINVIWFLPAIAGALIILIIIGICIFIFK